MSELAKDYQELLELFTSRGVDFMACGAYSFVELTLYRPRDAFDNNGKFYLDGLITFCLFFRSFA